MDNSIIQVQANLINDSVKFSARSPGKHEIVSDYIPPLGDGKSYLPLELFLISFAACAGGTIAPLLRRMGCTVRGLQVNAKGLRREQHPTGFKKIILDIVLTSPDTEAETLKNVVKLVEERYCPVWAMVKGNVEVVYELRIES